MKIVIPRISDYDIHESRKKAKNKKIGVIRGREKVAKKAKKFRDENLGLAKPKLPDSPQNSPQPEVKKIGKSRFSRDKLSRTKAMIFTI